MARRPDKGVREAFRATLAQSFTLLSGRREALFPTEPALRLFQLKLWISGADSMTDAYQEAGRLFAAMILNRSCSSLLRTKALDTAMLGAITKNGELIKHALAQEPFYGFLRTPSLVDWRRHLRKTEGDREALDLFTTLRLQIADAGADPSRNVTLPIYAKEAQKGFKPSNMKQIYKDRASKSPYLWVAKRYTPYILSLEATRSAVLKQLAEDAKRQEEFLTFCARLSTVLMKLQPYEGKWITEYTGVDPVELPDTLPPLSSEQLSKLEKNPRRPAEETKQASRQFPEHRRR